ncbi:MAG: creatininase family protein [Methylotenera sp.]|nr:creatininase family protein [Oligoflexia bacterium]
MEPIFLSELPNREAQRLVQSGAPVVATFNPVEYHGPHLPLDTDTLLSISALKAVFERLRGRSEWPFLIHSVVRAGCGAVPSHGTTQHNYRQVRKIVMNTCEGIRDLGAKRAILMTFHGEPLHNLAIEDGVKLLQSWGIKAFAPMNVVMNEALHYQPVNYKEAIDTIQDLTLREYYRDYLMADFHGGFFETSLMLHWNPKTVETDYAQVPPCPPVKNSAFLLQISRIFREFGWDHLARELDFANYGLTWYKISPTPGYTGNPGLANETAGRIFAERTTDLIVKAWLDYFEHGVANPRPVLRWVRPLTLQGRLI